MSDYVDTVTPSPTIIPFDERHTDAAKRLWQRYFGGDEDHFDAWLDDACVDAETPTQGYVAVDGETVAGFGIATHASPEFVQDYIGIDVGVEPWSRTGILHILVVNPQYRNQGVGTRLVRRRLRWLEDIADVGGVIGVSWHREDSIDSRPLFERFGFESVATVEEYYTKAHNDPGYCVDCEGPCKCDATIYRMPFGEGDR